MNQHFRELHRAGGQELGRTRLERLRGALLAPASLRLLSRRGWFPVLAPVEVTPELLLGAWRVRLHAVAGTAGPCHAAISFWHGDAAAALGEVPERVFSEAWRDVDEALALGLTDSSFVPSPARAALLGGLAPRLGLRGLRVEADHVAFRVDGEPERITLHNARPASGALLADAEARALAAPHLPFDDDGGVAALLVGRILHRVRASSVRALPVAEAPPAEPQEGT